ncbi:bifunctional oligoribonuclease/PAP phosphatase NrnA [Candidatus Parcubacteria bacterium]|nr:bifunctional oligoribonuclease/PAP phosphatase NrnA [Candidatus Parcubacteria bacterium]
MKLLFNQLEQAIKNANDILLVSHRSPDPDTLGSALALGSYTESLGKKASFFCLDKIPDNFSFINGAKRFADDVEIFLGVHDLVIFVDCSELGRCGVEDVSKYKKQTWAVIDHHVNKQKEADIVVRDSRAGANCEIIYDFLEFVEFSITPDVATALLSGLLIDTNFLSNAAATEKSVNIASSLLSLGADYRRIVKFFYANKNPEILRVWGMALSRLKFNKEKNIASTAVFKNDVSNNHEAVYEALEGLANFLNAILDADIILVLKEVDGGAKGSFRSNSDKFNVAEIAAQYGGGGHKRAAGFFVAGGKIAERDNEWRVDKIS